MADFRPTLEEIQSWGQSFDRLMRSAGEHERGSSRGRRGPRPGRRPAAAQATSCALFHVAVAAAAGRKVFRDFLRGEYSEENIMFWLACEELKRETDPDAVEEKARFIYEDYISILSPKEVSVESRGGLRGANRPLTWAPVAGVAGLAGARDREPEHGGAHAAHLRRGAAADLHAHAPGLVPALRQLAPLQGAREALLGRGGALRDAHGGAPSGAPADPYTGCAVTVAKAPPPRPASALYIVI